MDKRKRQRERIRTDTGTGCCGIRCSQHLLHHKAYHYSFYAVGIRSAKVYGRPKPARKPIDFIGKRKVFFIISVLHCVSPGLRQWEQFHAGKGDQALNYSMEFKGGTSTTVTFDKEYTLEEIDSQIVPKLEDVTGR